MDAGVTGSGAHSVIAVPAPAASAHSVGWAMRSVAAADVEMIAGLRATVMRVDLERLGCYVEQGVRQRLRDFYSLQHTSIIRVEHELVRCVTVRPAEGRQWLEHFSLAQRCQGQGLGSAVSRTVLA